MVLLWLSEQEKDYSQGNKKETLTLEIINAYSRIVRITEERTWGARVLNKDELVRGM